MSDYQKLFSSKLVKVEYKSFSFHNPSSINGPAGELSLGSVPGNPTTFGPLTCLLAFGLPVYVNLQMIGEAQVDSTGYIYHLKATGTLHEVTHPPEPFETSVVIKLDSKRTSGTIQFGASFPEVLGPLPVQAIDSRPIG